MRRMHLQELSRAQFVELFERPRMPTVITGLIEDWPAQERWTEQALLQRFGDHRFKVRILPAWLGYLSGSQGLCLASQTAWQHADSLRPGLPGSTKESAPHAWAVLVGARKGQAISSCQAKTHERLQTLMMPFCLLAESLQLSAAVHFR